MWEHCTTSRGGEGGKEGRVSLVSLGAKTVSPVSLGRTGGEGRGKRRGWIFRRAFWRGWSRGKGGDQTRGGVNTEQSDNGAGKGGKRRGRHVRLV
ncbi:hypothetical protein DPMN_021981 [Dreissena polymorpha]|uniref:Uncharacterized protein n=1 Tax=Dreissena polymorpha TaxID=45954 RepID=A0A9D4NMX0_DREPO|nr:hypothetical protein DPMN_021981 [Dreissena polymorpha]